MKTALITGASRGIGLAVAEELGRDHLVYVGSTTPEGAQRIVDKLPNARPFVADLTDPDDVARAVEATALESLDCVFHSAGVVSKKNVADADWDEWRGVFEINLFAVAELTRLLLPALRAARGTVITVNSGSGYHSGAQNALYSGSKFALRAFTDALREEELGKIRVTSVHPGRVDTDMQKELRRLEGHSDDEYEGWRWVRPESVAAAVRMVVDLGEDATVNEVSVRPSGLNG
jgi:NAD(P)-dependent dehydrogenase (short-subunit alcohol dehydrogenase family)